MAVPTVWSRTLGSTVTVLSAKLTSSAQPWRKATWDLRLRMDSRTLRNSRVPTALSLRRLRCVSQRLALRAIPGVWCHSETDGVKTKYGRGLTMMALYFLGSSFRANT